MKSSKPQRQPKENIEIDSGSSKVKIPTSVIVGVVTAICTAIGGAATGQYRIAQLEEKVKEHNNVRLEVVKMQKDIDYLVQAMKELKLELNDREDSSSR